MHSRELEDLFQIPQVKNLVCVTSTIHYPNKGLSYSPVRSIYSPRERFEQLKKTIQSVREKMAGCFIVVLETSQLSEEEKRYLDKKVDALVLFDDNKKVQKLSNGPFKGAAEVCLLKCFLDRIIECSFDILHKISGRYYLNKNYESQRLCTDRYNFTGSKGILNTRYYTVPYKEFNSFLLRLRFIAFFSPFGRSIEWWFNLFLPKNKINLVTPIGVSGNSAADGIYIEE